LEDSRRTGCASGDQKRAGASIFCSAKRPVSSWLAAGVALAAGALPAPESQPENNSSAAAMAAMPALLKLNILDVGITT
jgi:hypothetical protein